MSKGAAVSIQVTPAFRRSSFGQGNNPTLPPPAQQRIRRLSDESESSQSSSGVFSRQSSSTTTPMPSEEPTVISKQRKSGLPMLSLGSGDTPTPPATSGKFVSSPKIDDSIETPGGVSPRTQLSVIPAYGGLRRDSNQSSVSSAATDDFQPRCCVIL